MNRRIFIFITSLFILMDSVSAVEYMPKRFNTVTSHSDVYPYVLNNANPNINKNTSSTNTGNNKSSAPFGKRNVVKRNTRARAATNVAGSDSRPDARRVVSRPNISVVRSANNPGSQNNSVVRSVNNRNSQNVTVRSAEPVRARATATGRVVNTSSTQSENRVSSQRCFSDYKECMEMYCKREDTAYNRCYCSAKLAQIDSKYQDKIDNLIQQITRLQYGDRSVTSDEIKEYWDQTVGVYTQTNPWVNIDNALNIDWADTQSRIRGQKAFNTGHEYCVQHLRSCYYMANNLRDSYKSEIARDCATYEKGLQKIQEAAESVIESYRK